MEMINNIMTEKLKECNLKYNAFKNSLSKKQLEKYLDYKIIKSDIERIIKKDQIVKTESKGGLKKDE